MGHRLHSCHSCYIPPPLLANSLDLVSRIYNNLFSLNQDSITRLWKWHHMWVMSLIKSCLRENVGGWVICAVTFVLCMVRPTPCARWGDMRNHSKSIFYWRSWIQSSTGTALSILSYAYSESDPCGGKFPFWSTKRPGFFLPFGIYETTYQVHRQLMGVGH